MNTLLTLLSIALSAIAVKAKTSAAAVTCYDAQGNQTECKSKLSSYALAGIAVGSILIIIFIFLAIAVLVALRRKRKQRHLAQTSEESLPPIEGKEPHPAPAPFIALLPILEKEPQAESSHPPPPPAALAEAAAPHPTVVEGSAATRAVVESEEESKDVHVTAPPPTEEATTTHAKPAAPVA